MFTILLISVRKSSHVCHVILMWT